MYSFTAEFQTAYVTTNHTREVGKCISFIHEGDVNVIFVLQQPPVSFNPGTFGWSCLAKLPDDMRFIVGSEFTRSAFPPHCPDLMLEVFFSLRRQRKQ